ncbi:MAG TPA: patatin-like phospholipase family protein [Candidatus Acidoferrales bacterium]
MAILLALAGVVFASAVAAQTPAATQNPSPAQPQTDATTPAVAQNKSHAVRRPRIGLVLEGGGALGLAHIGVIQWMEEHHIPVRYVAGTSMGALVGSVYATGHSADEIEALIAKIQWEAVIRGATPYKDLSFRRKEDAQDYPNSLEFGLKHGIQFPEGFNSGQQVGLILDQIALPYSDVKNFNDFPISFGCVSTDLVSGKEEVFRTGSLALALRSTMSLPGIFVPVRDGDRIFADGALLDNLPVDVAQDMGADLTIAVHLQVKPLDPKDPLTTFSVLGRSLSVVIAANELRSMEQADVLISVPLEDFSSFDYPRADEMIKVGYAAAEKKSGVLSAFSLNDEDWRNYVEQRNSRKRTKLPAPQFVQVPGASPDIAALIQNSLAGVIGQPLDAATLDKQIDILTGTGRFSNLGYQIVDKNGQTGISITAVEKTYAPPVVRPLILLDGSDYENPRFSIGARITFFDVGAFGRELRNDVILGSEYGVSSEYFVPFKKASKWFVAPRLFADNAPFDAYQEDKLVAEYRDRQVGGGLDFGYEFGRDAELRFGYQLEDQRFTPRIGDPNLVPSIHGRSGITRVQYVLDRDDDAVIPRNGYDFQFDGDWHDAQPGAMKPFPSLEAKFNYYKRLNAPSSLFFSAEAGTTLGYQQVGIPVFSLGGSQRMAAYGTNELLTNQYYYFRAGYLRELFPLPPLLGDKLYFITDFEISKPFQVLSSEDLPLSSRLPRDGAAGFVANTIFGPVLIAGSVGDADHHRFYFRIGRLF